MGENVVATGSMGFRFLFPFLFLCTGSLSSTAKSRVISAKKDTATTRARDAHRLSSHCSTVGVSAPRGDGKSWRSEINIEKLGRENKNDLTST